MTVQVAMAFRLVICVFKLAVQVEMHQDLSAQYKPACVRYSLAQFLNRELTLPANKAVNQLGDKRLSHFELRCIVTWHDAFTSCEREDFFCYLHVPIFLSFSCLLMPLTTSPQLERFVLN